MAVTKPSLAPNSNILLACHITGVYDVNRSTTLAHDNYELVRNWAESVANAKLQGIIFHNNFIEKTCKKYQNEYISFIKIAYNPKFNPNAFRYFVYKDFLEKHLNIIKNVFVKDVYDVTLIKNPFIESYFIENPTAIFCGDEPKILDNDWMKSHSFHFRKTIKEYADYEEKFKNASLLNCGIIGGEITIFFDFVQKLCDIHKNYNSENKTAFTGDMGAFNYLARTQFNNQLIHGKPVNTIFKEYENKRLDCWFRHK